ncbi:MAG: YihY/virulence factor BrkB family protein [Nitrospiraceae bacterium]|nr:MAG: YihY/virulence factor BrkB family protein [Nitrospiraceae bacterium]
MIADALRKITGVFTRRIWEVDTGSLSRFRAFAVQTLRLVYVAGREFTEGNLTLRAMSLVYTTLLSIVPILAISISVLKAFGVHNEVVEPFLHKFLEPLGERGVEITGRVIGFVENMKVGVLGSLGLGLLLYTVVSVIQKVEKSFNFIWRIERPRSLIRRFSDYISVLIIGPVLMFTAIGLTASFRSNTIVQKIVSLEPFGTVFYMVADKAPFFIVCAAFTFLYIFIPNTKVMFRSALVGGVIAGTMWETAGWAFASFVVTSTRYSAIYSGFAILLMFLIWLYVNWLILLVGAQVSFYHQYPRYISAKKKSVHLNNRLRERLVLLVMYHIGSHYYYSQKPWTLHSLVEQLNLPIDPVQEVISLLSRNSLIVETGDEPPAFLPARDLETIPLQELIDTVRQVNRDTSAVAMHLVPLPEVDRVMDKMDAAIAESLGEGTLKDLVRAAPSIQT